jgi:hypothetical protein
MLETTGLVNAKLTNKLTFYILYIDGLMKFFSNLRRLPGITSYHCII